MTEKQEQKDQQEQRDRIVEWVEHARLAQDMAEESQREIDSARRSIANAARLATISQRHWELEAASAEDVGVGVRLCSDSAPISALTEYYAAQIPPRIGIAAIRIMTYGDSGKTRPGERVATQAMEIGGPELAEDLGISND